MSALTRVLGALALVVALAACASPTRIARYGPLPGGEPLVTLVVSEDRAEITRECGACARSARSSAASSPGR